PRSSSRNRATNAESYRFASSSSFESSSTFSAFSASTRRSCPATSFLCRAIRFSRSSTRSSNHSREGSVLIAGTALRFLRARADEEVDRAGGEERLRAARQHARGLPTVLRAPGDLRRVHGWPPRRDAESARRRGAPREPAGPSF